MTNEEEPQQKLIITDSSKIYDVMSSYYLKETFSDIQLILSDKTLHAHKVRDSLVFKKIKFRIKF